MVNLYIIAPARSGAEAVKLSILKDALWIDRDDDQANPPSGEPDKSSVSYNPQDCFEISKIASDDADAKFLFISRSPIELIASSLSGWKSGKFVSHSDLEGWWGEKWSFQLLPKWDEQIGKPLPEVAANQFVETAEAAISDLADVSADRWTGIHFEDFLKNPQEVLGSALEHLGVFWAGEIGPEVPPSSRILTPPSPNKWHRLQGELGPALNPLGPRVQVINEFREKFGPLPQIELPKKSEPVPRDNKQDSAGTPFASSFTTSLVQLLKQAGASMIITTYKSGHLITARVDNDAINTDFQSMRKPMGIASSGSRLAVGTQDSIVTYSNQPHLARNLKSIHPATTVFAPRSEVMTGDIAIHEMGFGTSEEDRRLFFINTSFSCLCVLDFDYSWVPIWRPKWISAYAAEDRCHLNGLAMVDGKPKYVTALAETDEPHGWREFKGTSGLIIDVTDDRVVTSGLAMPHSPTWHQDQLWVLESGKGTLSKVNVETGEVSTVATLPGFTRGLSFIGKYALVGLSQVRESVFKSLPITETQQERNCGVWAVDTETGQIVGFLKFEGGVQEIFDVAVLFGASWPEFIGRGQATESSFVLPEKVISNFQPGRPAAAK